MSDPVETGGQEGGVEPERDLQAMGLNWRLGARTTLGRLGLLAIAAFVAFLYTHGLDAYELAKIDEGRSGVIVRDIVEHGHWLLPRTPDGYLAEKPPVYYALCALLAPLWGIDAHTLRGVSAAMALGTIALVWLLTRLYGSGPAALIAALVLASNLLVLSYGRCAMVDMTLSCFSCGGLTACLAARKGWLRPLPAALVCATCFGLATLTKGPVGAVLGVLAVIISGGLDVRLWTRRISAHAWSLLIGFGVFTAIVLAWYVPGYLRSGREFLLTCLWSENFYMPIGHPIGIGVAHSKSLQYYPVQELLAFAPVAPFLPLTLHWMISEKARSVRRELGLWFVSGFAVFMLAANKRGHYLLPLQPAAAALIGLAAADRLQEPLSRLVSRSAVLCGTALSITAALGLLLAARLVKLPEGWGSEVLRAMVSSGRVHLCAASGLLLLCGLQLLRASQRSTAAVVHATLALGLSTIAARSLVYEPFLGQLDATRPLVKAMVSLVPAGSPIALLVVPAGYSFEFYWPGRVIRNPTRVRDFEFWVAERGRLAELPGPIEVLGSWSLSDPPQEWALVRRGLSAAPEAAGASQAHTRAAAEPPEADHRSASEQRDAAGVPT